MREEARMLITCEWLRIAAPAAGFSADLPRARDLAAGLSAPDQTNLDDMDSHSTDWKCRAERGCARLSRAFRVVGRIAVPGYGQVASRTGCMFMHHRAWGERPVLPRRGRAGSETDRAGPR